MLTAKKPRIEIKHLRHFSVLNNEVPDVINGLSYPSKTLPPKYFYDQLGSELFEQICDLPEYYPTRSEI